MNISKFFIDRPIFAAVLSIVIFVAGLIALPLLPVAEYPDVVPPSVVVRAVYPGANPKVIAETVAIPLEEAISGVEDMIYMRSVASSNGVLLTTVTFRPGTDPDEAAVRVQNRVAQAQARLPEDVRRQGITTEKRSPVFLMVVHLVSPNGTYDTLYMRNYARLHIRDALARIPGVGSAELLGSGDYAMRAWLDPNRIAALGLTASDVVNAMREQNIQVSAGQIGAEPMLDSQFLRLVNAQGRLTTEEEFGDIVIATGENGEIVRLADVARLELGAGDFSMRSQLNEQNAAAILIFQSPGANILDIRDSVIETMEEMSTRFPEDMRYEAVYDTTIFVRESIHAVISTLLEAVVLVVLVVILFLQTWRASIIPLLAVPVSIVGTFAVLHVLGFTVNTLTLFGLVLAIGIVVDDAIVVVENVERHIEDGASPLVAAHRAMREVSGPIVAITLVLCAVFVPMAFLTGVAGEFYKQFAVTIAISVAISGLNSLTLSPALAARLLLPHNAPKDLPSRLIDRLLGWFFRPFNHLFGVSSQRYQHSVSRLLSRRGAVFVVYALLLFGTGWMFQQVPTGFIPIQDRQNLIAGVRMPEGSSIERTDAMLRQLTDIAKDTEGVEHRINFPGRNVTLGTTTPNIGGAFFPLKPFHERSRSASEINAELNRKFAALPEGFGFAIMPPSILGLGTAAGYSLYIEDRANLGYGALQEAVTALQRAIAQTPGMSFPITSYQSNMPQFDVDVDRVKAKAQGVPLTELFSTMQTYLGSSYVNDFTLFGRTWQVIAQADAPFRDSVEDIGNLRTRNSNGEMVPISSMVTIRDSFGPDPVMRYNGYPAADLNGAADPRVLSSGEAMAKVAELARQILPNGMTIEWTDLSYEQAAQSNTAVIVFALAALLAFLVLAALYESWTLPLAVVLIVPMCMLSALFGVWWTGGDNNVFVQIGLVVLMGLACKNAILIVEFARDLELQGKGIVEAALEACRLRLRPIVMTSVAFIAGTVPLVLSSGAGSEIRSITGITVFSGMVGVTLFGLFLTPVFYVVLRKLANRPLVSHAPQHEEHTIGLLEHREA